MLKTKINSFNRNGSNLSGIFSILTKIPYFGSKICIFSLRSRVFLNSK
jgi:hypothetical protein